MKPQHALAALACCGLLLVLAFWSWPQPETTQVGKAAEGTAAGEAYDVDANGVSDDSSVAKSSMATQTRAARKVLPETPSLPAFDTPFKDSFDALLDATLAGNSDAACRLMGESRRCRSAGSMLRYLVVPASPEQLMQSEQFKSLDPTSQESALSTRTLQYENALTERQLLEEAVENCGEVDYSPRAVSEYMLRAADAGDIHSQLEYARGQFLGTRLMLENPQILGQYRANAHDFFENALRAGEPDAVRALWSIVLWPDMSPLSLYIPKEWSEPGFVVALASRLPKEWRDAYFPANDLERFSAETTPEQQQRADAIYAQYFAANIDDPKWQSSWKHKESKGMLDIIRNQLNRELERCK